ncbi:MAG: hypothetical protein L3J74_01770 [Bacteroidales bacterium]|nr:hypothetical protein [Bacteroidales bacterium]
MYQKLFILLFFVLNSTAHLFAQTVQQKKPENIYIQDNIYRLNLSLQGIYFSYEKRLAPFVSLYSDLGMGGVLGWGMNYGYRWAISPTIATEGRWYFNYKTRYKNGKKLLFNAVDFLSLQAAYIFKPIERQITYINSGYFLVVNIGMQRTWGKHINFELKFGYGISYSDEYNAFGQGFNLNLKFGYIFNRLI